MTRWELVGRGFIAPCLITCNVVAVQQRSVLLVFGLGVLIAFVWSGSVRVIAAPETTGADRFSYWLGAGFGSVLGMVAGSWLSA
jgi:hypothetical protein